MRPENFDLACDLLEKRSGLMLTRDKVYLLENRLMPVARKRKMKGLDELLDAVRRDKDEGLINEFVEAMTTNETFFFRDAKPFEQLRETILPRFMKHRADVKKLRIWCAAACTGQEPYSIAMVLRESFPNLADWRIEIIGTDISKAVLDRARAGVYSQFEVQRGLPVKYLIKYFHQDETRWQIDDSIRSMVSFREFNLLNSLAPIGRCDIVFCRNVLIYFGPETKTQVLDGISELLPPDGVLYLGGAETVLGISDKFSPMPNHSGVYAIAGYEDASASVKSGAAAAVPAGFGQVAV